MEEFKQQGFMKEAIAFVLKYGFQEMDLHRVEALVSPNNVPSLKLIKHFGFQEEGLLKEHYFIDGKFEDSLIFGLLKRNFQG
jgi:ribosomal-protein-alanine N-acetyltransferase